MQDILWTLKVSCLLCYLKHTQTLPSGKVMSTEKTVRPDTLSGVNVNVNLHYTKQSF